VALSHDQIWQAIDNLAQRHGYSASGLAKKAGLDPTTFNKSKRISADGKPRWPSTESVSKLLTITGESMGQFLGLENEDMAVGMPLAIMTTDDKMITGTLLKREDDVFYIAPSDSSQDSRRIDRKDIAWLAQIMFTN